MAIRKCDPDENAMLNFLSDQEKDRSRVEAAAKWLLKNGSGISGPVAPAPELEANAEVATLRKAVIEHYFASVVPGRLLN